MTNTEQEMRRFIAMRNRQIKLLELKIHSLTDFQVNDDSSFDRLSYQKPFIEKIKSDFETAIDSLISLGDYNIDSVIEFQDKYCQLISIVNPKLKSYAATLKQNNSPPQLQSFHTRTNWKTIPPS